jgi:hypothetical protein
MNLKKKYFAKNTPPNFLEKRERGREGGRE